MTSRLTRSVASGGGLEHKDSGDGIDPEAAAGLELIFESLTQDLEAMKACVAQHISAA